MRRLPIEYSERATYSIVVPGPAYVTVLSTQKVWREQVVLQTHQSNQLAARYQPQNVPPSVAGGDDFMGNVCPRRQVQYEAHCLFCGTGQNTTTRTGNKMGTL